MIVPRETFEAARGRIQNLSTARHAYLVEGVIRWARPRVVLEIGAFHGYMSATIARALQEVGEGGHLRILDSFHDYRTSPALLRANLEACGCDNWELEISSSARSRPGRVDLAVIDGDHSEEWAVRDTEFAIAAGAWCLMWHDSHAFEGVRIAVDHVRGRQNWGVVELPFDAGYALAIERFDNGPPEVDRRRSYL